MTEELFRTTLADIQNQLDKARQDISFELSRNFFQEAELSEAQSEIAHRLYMSVERFDPLHCETCKEDYLVGLEHAHHMIARYLGGMLTRPTKIFHANYVAEDNSEGQSVALFLLKNKLTIVSALNDFSKNAQKVLEDKMIEEAPPSELTVLFDGKQYHTSGITSVTVFYEEIETYVRPDILQEIQQEVKRKYE